ncbi:hypothetical protein [Marinomonas gallaica]|uniref:hypothetical protein n=1 Tax=Marinomonas gallaica TaxID=1806667 RepID=UPI003A8D746E
MAGLALTLYQRKHDGVSGLVAVNSLMAMVGGVLTAMLIGKTTLALFIMAP